MIVSGKMKYHLAAGILAGGESRRMGAPKEGVRLSDGRPMIEHVIEAASHAVGGQAPLAIVGRCDGWAIPPDSGIHHVLDRRNGRGPMAGLEALLGSGLAVHYLVCTCDQPHLTARLLALLAGAAGRTHRRPAALKTASGDELDPFPCLLPASWLEQIQCAIGEDQLSVRALLHGSDPVWITIPDEWARQVRSVNTPDDLAPLK